MYVYLSITLVCVGGGGWDGQLAIAWVDGEAMVDTAWEEVMTVKGAETVSVLEGAAADVQVGAAEVLVEVGLGDPDGKWEGLVDDDKGWPKPGR